MRICTICARGGSEGLPGKNIKLLDGLPLIGHSINLAKKSGLFDLIVVDSDSDQIRQVAQDFDPDLVLERPPELATAESGKLAAIARAVREAEKAVGHEFRTIVDLDVTSPLRREEDVAGTIALVEKDGADSGITATAARRSPYFNLVELRDDGSVGLSKPSSVKRRQDSPICYDMNASVYAWPRLPFLQKPFLFGERTLAWIMPWDRSVDIDDEFDFQVVEMLMEQRR